MTFEKLLSRWRMWLPLGALLLAVCVFFSPYLLHGKIFLAGDMIFGHFPWRAYAPVGFKAHNPLITDPVNANFAELYNRQIKSGTISQWNPYLFTGLPSTSVTAMSGMPGRFYPLRMVSQRLLSTVDSFMWMLMFHVLLMGVSMYLYLREVGASNRGALFGATAFMFNGYAMVWLEFEGVAYTAAFFPLLLLIMERFLGDRPLRAGLLGGAVFGLIALMGNQQYVSYIGLLMGFYLIFLLVRLERSGRDRRRAGMVLLAFGVTVTCGILLAAIDILPNLDLMHQSSRIARNFTFTTFFSTLGRVPFRFFVTLIFPFFFGSAVHPFNVMPALPTQEYMNYNELCLYMGIPTLFAFLALLVARQDKFTRFYLFMTALVVALLAGTVVYYPFFKLFPGMNRTNPTRLIFLFSFVVSAGAGLGFHRLEGFDGRRRAAFLAAAAALVALGTTIALTAARMPMLSFFNRELFPLGQQRGFLLAELTRLRSMGSPLMLKPFLILVASALLVTLLVTLKKRLVTLAVFGALLTLLAYDLISFGWEYNTIVESKFIYPRTPAIDFLLRQQGPFRVLQDTGRGLWVNSLVPFGIEEVGGYTSFYPERVGRLMSYIEYGSASFGQARFDRWIMFRNIFSPLFDLLNVRYLLTAPGANLNHPKLKLVYRGDLDIYENVQALPRAFVVHRAVVQKGIENVLSYMGSGQYDMRNVVVLEDDPAPGVAASTVVPAFLPRVKGISYAPEKVVLEADLAAAGWLVLTDTYFPGWIAEVDGIRTPILRANCNYRAVALTAGRHAVTFVYRPISFALGRIITLMAVFGIGIGMVVESRWARNRRLRGISPPGAVSESLSAAPNPSGRGNRGRGRSRR